MFFFCDIFIYVHFTNDSTCENNDRDKERPSITAIAPRNSKKGLQRQHQREWTRLWREMMAGVRDTRRLEPRYVFFFSYPTTSHRQQMGPETHLGPFFCLLFSVFGRHVTQAPANNPSHDHDHHSTTSTCQIATGMALVVAVVTGQQEDRS
jgi:hypothetical protein